ncbi:MAG: hypothetical protein HYZ75_19410 [Elusimicrobia bacterium]|nr:hypothetical protein [Elusimicrobiota bacterium]
MAKTTRKTVDAVVDFPRAGEVIAGPDYTLRISAPAAARVEVSIDNSGWQPCREALGLWWYDWRGCVSGTRQLRVQALGGDGRILAVASRHVTVRLHEDEP